MGAPRRHEELLKEIHVTCLGREKKMRTREDAHLYVVILPSYATS